MDCLRYRVGNGLKTMTKAPPWPFASFILAIVTFVASVFVSLKVNGLLFSTVPIVELGRWGGVRYADVAHGEVWRLLTAQLVHVKWPHMLYNAGCLLMVGGLIERQIGFVRTLAIWAFAGGGATLISPILVAYPYNVGSGASQAVLAFVGCASVLVIRGRLKGRLAFAAIGLALLPALTLDLVFAGYPKPGHVLALVAGAAFGCRFRGR